MIDSKDEIRQDEKGQITRENVIILWIFCLAPDLHHACAVSSSIPTCSHAGHQQPGLRAAAAVHVPGGGERAPGRAAEPHYRRQVPRHQVGNPRQLFSPPPTILLAK